jgi:O-antigen/teichoic acid export membrane protein
MHLASVLKNSPFLRHNTIYFLGSFASAILNYLYYPVLGRFMDIVHFGETQVLISLFMQFSIFFTAHI